MKEKPIKSNSYYEGLIQNLYGGAEGCFSAFMHFFYQHNQCEVFYPEYSCCFEKIYQLELENCEFLSKVLLRMAGDNKYYSSSKKFLSGYNIDYVKNLDKIFLLDIEFLELNVIEIKNLICKIDDLEIKKMLKKVLENKKNSLKIVKENYLQFHEN